MPRIILAQNRYFSDPLRVLYPAVKLSPPKAPPKDAPVCCSRIEPTNKTARIICIYGSIPKAFILDMLPRQWPYAT